MPADYFAALINATHEAAEKKKQEFEKNRDFDIDIYKQIALNPNTPPDKAAEAAKKIDQLMNLGKKESPWSKLTDHLNQIRTHIQQPGGDPGLPGGKLQIPGQGGGASPQGGRQSTSGSAPGTGEGTNTLGFPQQSPQQNPQGPQQNPVKQGFAQRAIKRVSRGLGTALGDVAGVAGGALGTRQPSLPSLDVSGIPRSEDITKQKTQSVLDQVAQYEKGGLSHQEALAAAGVRLPSQSGMMRRGADVLGSRLPEGAIGPDGQPITDPDPKELYYPMVGRDGTAIWYPTSASIGHVNFGNRVHAFNRYTGDIFGDDNEIIGNIAEQQVSYGTSRARDTPAYDAAGNPTTLPLGSSTTPQTAPPVGGGKTPTPGATPQLKNRPSSLPPMTGGEASTPSGGGKVYAGQFGQFSKGAMGVTEAAAALVGDQPGQAGGLLGQLNVFDDPKQVKALSDYFTAQSQFMEQEARTNQGSVLDYIVGLPSYLTDLKSSTLADKYNALNPQAKSFVDAFTRAIGTAPGLRGVTSASSALGALRTIEREYPNPQFIKDKKSAIARLKNLMNEIKQAGSFNPLLRNKLKSLPSVDDKGDKKKVTVNTKEGNFIFDSQEQADAFKQAAGIK